MMGLLIPPSSVDDDPRVTAGGLWTG